jgi:putative hydrolase of the HAD superfamily
VALPPGRLETALRETWSELSREIPAGSDRYRHFAGGEQEYWLRFARGTIERASGSVLADSFLATTLERLRAAFLEREAWRLYADVAPALDTLRGMGARLCVVSNWDSRLPAVLRLHELHERFDAIVFSHDVGLEKPHPGIFRRALTLLRAAPAECLHVGDVAELDVAGANAAGIDAVLLDRGAAAKEGALTTLADLPAIVRGNADPRVARAARGSEAQH